MTPTERDAAVAALRAARLSIDAALAVLAATEAVAPTPTVVHVPMPPMATTITAGACPHPESARQPLGGFGPQLTKKFFCRQCGQRVEQP